MSFGTNATNKYITTYFRRAFYIPDPALIKTLTTRLVRDDGAVEDGGIMIVHAAPRCEDRAVDDVGATGTSTDCIDGWKRGSRATMPSCKRPRVPARQCRDCWQRCGTSTPRASSSRRTIRAGDRHGCNGFLLRIQAKEHDAYAVIRCVFPRAYQYNFRLVFKSRKFDDLIFF